MAAIAAQLYFRRIGTVLKLTRFMQIREALSEDCASLAQLITELGYPTTGPEMSVRFAALAALPHFRTLVACIEGRIVGMAGACWAPYFEKNGSYVRVLALVTRAEARGVGVGRSLLRALEQWGFEMGASTLLLTCGNRPERQTAHRFYQELGFHGVATGYSRPIGAG